MWRAKGKKTELVRNDLMEKRQEKSEPERCIVFVCFLRNELVITIN